MDEIAKSVSELDKSGCREAVHVIDEKHPILKGAEVIEYGAKHIPGVSKFTWLLENGMGQKTTHFFYDKINEFRSK